VVLGVRADGQKALLAIKSMGGESTKAWRMVLDMSATPPSSRTSVSARCRLGSSSSTTIAETRSDPAGQTKSRL
jgi:hypothetical protein